MIILYLKLLKQLVQIIVNTVNNFHETGFSLYIIPVLHKQPCGVIISLLSTYKSVKPPLLFECGPHTQKLKVIQVYHASNEGVGLSLRRLNSILHSLQVDWRFQTLGSAH